MNYTYTRQREIIVVAQDNANESKKYQPFERNYNLLFIGLNIT